MRAPFAIALSLLLSPVAIHATDGRADQNRARPPFVVIVHPRNSDSSADRKFLEDAFLKKVTTWPDGEDIHPADLVADSPVRRRFSEDVLNRSVEAVKAYWQQRIFSGGDVPPPEFESDDEVVRYVAGHEGAVGYVSGAANIGGTKVLGVR
jgi:ABC-type phosphate transport system substrate-binding protein